MENPLSSHTATPPSPEEPKGEDSVQEIVRHCHDCGKPTTGPLLMNIHIAGDFQYLCPDCKEENDPDDVMQEPCPRCRGSGIEWEGWNCEYCDGAGTADF